ncbi:hypothetical protein [Pseudoflavonifractor sp. An187]|uniref:hypothetical protein n=1 Tax=Pseudoflavonifractor sp. An187 TaxID=1965578 RepID=UPI000B374D8F|nr:hypothetical protein [Pseudoflavonifractor sp. An187]OUP45785.1 hypothetical protein B5F22_03270 [Pseudoflavonifractor sp. An187]
MDTVIVASSQFYSHYPKRIPQGTVNAEAVLIRLDSEWDNLTVRIHWLNVASSVEKVVFLERDQPNTIPWEVLTELGELRMGLDGMDGGTIVKPTVWLTYGYVVDGVDPEAGEDPQPPTPSWEQQMVEQATQANQAAQAAQKASEEAAKAVASAGPYADEAKKSAEAAKESQEAADTSADQANTAANAAKDHADAAGTAKVAAERAAETAGNAQSGAAQSAQAAANSAQAAERAKQDAQNAASALPAPSPEFAGMVPMVNPEGNGYIFGEAGGGGAGGELLLAEYIQQDNQEIHFTSFDWETGIGECTEPHGLTEATQAMLVWNDWHGGNAYANATAMPIEWTSLDQNLFLVPTDDTHVMVTGNDKSTPITVDASDDFNKNVDETKIHFEIPVGFRISDIPELYTKVQLTILGVVMGARRYRYITFFCRKKDGKDVWVNTINLLYPPYFGVVTKPRHGLLTSHNITFELNNVVGGSFLYSNYFNGRRNNYVGMPGEEYTEIKRAIQLYSPTEFFGVTGINVDPTYAVWANGTRFRLYGLCKGGEHK